MKDNKTILIILLVAIVLIVGGVLFYRHGVQQNKGYKGQSSGEGSGIGGWWSGLWDNAANIVDAGGRHTSSFVTSLTNGVSSIIATKEGKEAVFSEYGYSDRQRDYVPWIIGGSLILLAGIIFIKNK